MRIDIALLCFNRKDYLCVIFDHLLSVKGVAECNLVIYFDGARNQNDLIGIAECINIILGKAASRNILNIRFSCSSKNLGVWKNKIRAFEESFASGADVVLLVEDDVILHVDALQFVMEASKYAHSSDVPVTISLFSTSLLSNGEAKYSKAFEYIDEHPDVFSDWGVRKWPFPWGIALTKKVFERLVEKGWNGNDQDMGRALKELGGSDVFPAITRSEHIGEVSATHGKTIAIDRHFELKRSAVSSFDIKVDIPIDQAMRNADLLYEALMPDSGTEGESQQIFYTNASHLAWYKNTFSGARNAIEVKVLVDESDASCRERIHEITSEIFRGTVAICIGDEIARTMVFDAIYKHACRIIVIDPTLLIGSSPINEGTSKPPTTAKA